MKYGKQMIQTLDSNPAQPGEITVNGGPVEVRASIREAGKFGCQIDRITLKEKQPNASPINVRKAGEFLAERASYLSENLRLLECDEELKRSFVRSAEVENDGESVAYFEGEISPDSISFARYKTSRGSHSRESVPFVLTRDTLARLVDDLADSARSSD